jgi:hypothetical protein
MKLADYYFQEFTPPGSSFDPSGGRDATKEPKIPSNPIDAAPDKPIANAKQADIPPDQIPPVAYEPQNLNSFYTGFDKKARLHR